MGKLTRDGVFSYLFTVAHLFLFAGATILTIVAIPEKESRFTASISQVGEVATTPLRTVSTVEFQSAPRFSSTARPGSILLVGQWDFQLSDSSSLELRKDGVLQHTSVISLSEQLVVTWEQTSGALTVNSGDRTESFPIEDFLVLSPEGSFVVTVPVGDFWESFVITAAPTASSPSVLRGVGTASFLLGVATLMILPSRDRNYFKLPSKLKQKQPRTLPMKNWRDRLLHGPLAGIDIAVTSGILAGLLIMPAWPDDGWVLFRISQLPETYVSSDFFSEGDPWMIQGGLLESLYSSLVALGFAEAHFRVLHGVVLGASWIIIRKTAQALDVGVNKYVLVFSAALYFSSALALAATLRPEPVVSALLSVVLLLYAKFLASEESRFSVMIAIVAALALTTHQSGLVVLPFLIAVGWQYLRKKRLLALGQTFAIWLAVLAGGTFFQMSILQWFRELGFWGNRPSHSGGSELYRWVSLLGDPPWRWFPIIITVLLLIVLIVCYRNFREIQRAFLFPLALAPLALVGTASKWTWHIGSLLPVIVLIAFFALHISFQLLPRMKTVFNPKPLIPFFFVAVGFIVIAQPLRPFGWPFPLRETRYFAVHEVLEDNWEPVLLAVFLVAMFIALRGLKMISAAWNNRVLAGLALTSVLLPISVPLATFANDQRSNSVTPLKIRLDQLAGITNCGFGDGMDVYRTEPASSPGTARSDTSFELLRKYSQRPAFGEEVEMKFTPKAINLFWVRSEEYLEENHNVTFVITDSASGEKTSRSVSVQGTIWSLVAFVNNSENLNFSLQWEDADEGVRSIVVTRAVRGEKSSFLKETFDELVLAGPFQYTYFPCVAPPTGQSGFMEQPKYVIATEAGLPLRSPASEFFEIGYSRGQLRTSVRLLESSGNQNNPQITLSKLATDVRY